MRLLLLGGTGQVGTEAARVGIAARVFELFAPTRSAVDLDDLAAIGRHNRGGALECGHQRRRLYQCRSVPKARRQLAFAVNAHGALAACGRNRRRGIPLIHISTDYVFDGRKGAPYVETDAAGATQCLWPQQACR